MSIFCIHRHKYERWGLTNGWPQCMMQFVKSNNSWLWFGTTDEGSIVFTWFKLRTMKKQLFIIWNTETYLKMCFLYLNSAAHANCFSCNKQDVVLLTENPPIIAVWLQSFEPWVPGCPLPIKSCAELVRFLPTSEADMTSLKISHPLHPAGDVTLHSYV